MSADRFAPGIAYGRYTVLCDAARDKNGKRRVLCKCACGTEKVVATGRVE